MTTTDDTQGSGGASRPIPRVTLIAAALIAASVGMLLASQPLQSALAPNAFTVIVVILGFALAERFVFHVEYRREAHTFSVSEVPAALALVFLSPIAGVTIRVVISLAAFLATSRPKAHKLFLNAGLFMFEMSLAYWLVRQFAPTDDRPATQFLIVAAIALAASSLAGSVIVSVVIAQFEGSLFSRLAEEFRTVAVTTPVLSMLATVAVAPALFRPELVLFALVPIAAAWMILVQFGQLTQHHRDLQALHGFAGVVGQPLRLGTVTTTAIDEIVRLARARRGFLQVYDVDGEIAATGHRGAPIGNLPSGRFDERWSQVMESDRPVTCEFGADGDVRIGAPTRQGMIAVPIRDETGILGLLVIAERAGAVSMFEQADVSRVETLAAQLASTLRRALLHARMEHLALHDVLTGEANRLGFEDAVDRAAARHATRGGCTAVVMLDLDRFKEVNDTLGHQVGDRVLRRFASRIQQHLGVGDVLSRFGGDEFAILVHRASIDEITDLAEQIIEGSYAPLRLDELDLIVTASVGIAEMSRKGGDTAELLRQADVAMYTAKRERTRIEIYRQDIDRRTPERLSLLGSLREVLDRQGLEVHYQPKIDLVTSTVIGAEALVRWHHPTRGWVSPLDFIQVAEESGLIKQLTDQVLSTSIQAASGWVASGLHLDVSVNLSAHDLLDVGLPQRIAAMLEAHGLPAEQLTLEITESALLADTPRTTGTIARLDDLGVKLSLDDFGTGYSSLAYLRRLPAAELKVDQSFVKNLLLDKQDEAIVRSTIDLGHNLGLRVVAEGIENVPVLERLRELGCDIGQGYGISRPLPPDKFELWLSTTEYGLPENMAAAWG